MKLWTRITVNVVIVLAFYGTAANGQDSTPAPSSTTASAAADAPVPQTEQKLNDRTFVIGAEDTLAISVWKEPDISRSIVVRSDGKISLPLAGEIVAAGQTPVQLEQIITAKLKSYITDPEVTVIVQQINSEKYNILGQVGRPGSYPLTGTTTIMDAIAVAGGFRDFAKKKGIYILRRNTAGVESHIPFNYQDFIRGKNTNQNITLQPHDTIIVP